MHRDVRTANKLLQLNETYAEHDNGRGWTLGACGGLLSRHKAKLSHQILLTNFVYCLAGP